MSFQQGISGLNAASRNLEVIGNNIANANTVGAKVARAEFADVYANAASNQWNAGAGMGVKVAAVTQQFTQGGIRTTENPLDMAINGRGFFQVSNPGTSEMAYSRNGEFQLRDNYIVNSQGLRLQGYAIDPASGKAGGVASDIKVSTQGIGPHVTTEASFQLNLDARTAAPATTMPAFSLTNGKSYTSTTSVPVYDQQGNEQTLSLYFRRTSVDNEWEVYASQNGVAVPAVTGSAPQDPVGRMTFNPDGTLDPAKSGTLTAGVLAPGNMALDLPFAASTLPVPPSSSTTTAPVSLSFAGSTQFGSAFGVTEAVQDGYKPGSLTGFGIAEDGTVQARYSNGKTLGAAQIALADFRSEQGLAPVGNNLWRATPASGEPAVSAPGTANLGALQGGALEDSNVDLTQQLVDMITAQRSYQANAQTIKTQDQMLSTLVNLR
jgi:flagellar hook protein FlgE